MTMRERMARAMCVADGIDPDARGFGMGKTMPEGAEYPLWEAQLKKLDAALDCLTAPPSEAAVTAGIAMLRGDETGPATGAFATYDPVGWYSAMVQRIWETMVRAMIGKTP